MPGYTGYITVVYAVDLPDDYVDDEMKDYQYSDSFTEKTGIKSLNRREVVKRLVQHMPKDRTFTVKSEITLIQKYKN